LRSENGTVPYAGGHFLTANIITANIFIRKNFKLHGIAIKYFIAKVW
jgi:hypothetical protein